PPWATASPLGPANPFFHPRHRSSSRFPCLPAAPAAPGGGRPGGGAVPAFCGCVRVRRRATIGGAGRGRGRRPRGAGPASGARRSATTVSAVCPHCLYPLGESPDTAGPILRCPACGSRVVTEQAETQGWEPAGGPAEELSPFAAGQVISHYRILEILGGGGM